MKSTFTFFMAFFLFGIVHTQIMVPVSTLPVAGDTLRTAMDNLPMNVEVGEPGPNRNWFFNGLQAPFVSETLVKAPSIGNNASSFPTANQFIKRQQDNLEFYYRVQDGKRYTLGFAGEIPIDLPVDAVGKYDGPGLLERNTPLEYQDEFSDDRNLFVPFSADFIPDTFFAGLPIRPDSIRLVVRTINQNVVDAWGKMMIPTGSYDVLRQKTTSITTRKIQGKASILPWLDVPFEFEGITGTDTTIIYTFLSNNTKEPIAVVTMAPDGISVANVEFKADSQVITSTYTQNQKSANMFAYPNPAIGSVRFDLVGLEPGKYQVKMFNILGVEVWSKNYNIIGPRTIRVELDRFNKGTYLYSLVNDKGRTIVTKRLIVLRP